MSIALGEFWKGLVKSGVTDAAGCKQIAGDYAEANAGTPPSDSQELASFLVQRGTLTEFQSEALLSDPPRDIRSGNFVVRSDVGPYPLRRWIPVSRVDDGRVGVLFRVAADQIAGGQDQWLQAHQEITAEGLQSFDFETQQSWTLVFSELPDGECLNTYLGNQGSGSVALSQREICMLGISLADALFAMHQRPLVHGAVQADQVWIARDGQAMLLRDPSGPPAGLGLKEQGWFDSDEEPGLYAAPELGRSDHACDVATDIYALGCLLFRLATGRYPTQGSSSENLVEAHASMTPPELAEAVKKGKAGDPLYRVLAFAMAKSPTSRFVSSDQLSNALKAILPLVAPEDVQVDAEQATSDHTPNEASEDGSVASGQMATKGAVKPDAGATLPTAGSAESSSPRAEKLDRIPAEKPDRRPKPPAVHDADSTAGAAEAIVTADRQEPAPVAEDAGRAKRVRTKKKSKAPGNADSTESATDEQTVTADREGPPDPPPVVEDAGQRANRTRRKKKSKAPLVLGGMCVAILFLIISLLVPEAKKKTAEKPKVRPPMPAIIPPVTNERKANTEGPKPREADDVAGYNIVEDDRLLYVPPFAVDTPPAALGFLPPGPAMVASLRLSSILESRVGGQLIDSLSPELDSLIALISERAKVPVESIEQCGLALHAGKDGWPEVSLAIQLKAPIAASELIEKWQVGASRTTDGLTIYAGDSPESDAYYFEGSGEDPISQFAIGSIAKISEVAEGGKVLLPRNPQALWNASSDKADIVVLSLSPNFLFADGREMLVNSVPELVDPLKSALLPDVSAAMLTVSFGEEQMFVETRLTASGGISEAALMQSLRERITQWPDWADDFILNTVPDASWRLLANRLPFMLAFVTDRVRFGVSDGMAIANAYLPSQAVPQVTLATVLALNTPPGTTASIDGPKSTKALTVEEMLNRKMSVTFDQESLEFAIDNIKLAFTKDLPKNSKMPNIRIIGGDLQLMGITQNQQVRDFKQVDVPLRKVLTELVLRANPDKTATGSKDEKQALIWVVVDNSANPGTKEILVTTRQSADGKYELPPEFVPE